MFQSHLSISLSLYIYIYIHTHTLSVTAIVVGNKIGDPSSNPG